MPHSIVAEKQVLGVVLLGTNYGAQAEKLLAELVPEDFYVPSHGEIWRVATEAWARHSTGDIPTVVRTAEEMGVAVDHAQLVSLVADSAGPLGARAAPTVIDRARRRGLLLQLDASIRATRDPAVDLGGVIDTLRGGLAHAELPLGTTPIPPDIHDLLVSNEPEYDWLVPGLLERGDRLMITAQEGLGKSIYLRELCVQLAGGYHPVTGLDTEPVKVLAVDLENSERQARRWYRVLNLVLLQHGRFIDEQMLFPVCRPQGLDLLDRSDVRWLLEHCAAVQPQVLTIGPIYKLHSGDPHEEGPARKVIAVLDRIRNLYGCVLIMETHSPHETKTRPGRPFGASIWMRWPEFGYSLIAQKSATNTFNFVAWRGARDERGWPQSYTKGGRWPWTPTPGTFTPPTNSTNPTNTEEKF